MFGKSAKRLSASRPPKDAKENIAELAPTVVDASAAMPIGGDDTPVKRGTMARIKDTFFSPFRAISPTNSPKSRSTTTLSFDAETSIPTKVLFSPGISNEPEVRKGALPMKRKSSKRTPSRKGTSMSVQLDRPPIPPASSIPKLDLANIFTMPSTKAASPRKDGSSSGRSSTASPRSASSRSNPTNANLPTAETQSTPVLTPRQVAFSAAPVLDISGNVVAVAQIPLPLTVQEIQFPLVPSTPLPGPPRSSSSGSPSRFSAKPPMAPQSQDQDASRSKVLSSAAKKREAPVSLQSPAKRRRLSLSSSKSGTTRSVVLSSPGKAANLFSQTPKDFGSSGLGDESLPDDVDSPSEKIITHTRAYSCDREITDKERKKASKSDTATVRDRSSTIVPMDVDYDASASNIRPRSGSASGRSEAQVSPRSASGSSPEAEKFSQGTMKEIIEWMLLSNESAAAADSFIMAYSHFKLSSADLFAAIFEMYQRVSNDINQKRRIVSFLSRWLDNQYSTDFLANGAAVGTVSTAQFARLRELMNQDGFDFGSASEGTSSGMNSNASAAAGSGKASVSKGSRRSSLGGNGRMSILRRGTISASATNRFEFMNMNHQDLALQLTVIEYTMLRSVSMNEFKNQAWNKAEKETKAPNLHAMISHFNKMSFWVATEIVTSDQIKEQVKRITKFIKLAGYLRDAGNLNAVMEIISGLNSLPVQRLRSAWRGVPSKHVSALKKMEDLMAPSQNFLKYRQELKAGTSTTGYVVPYIGVHLGDLVHIAEGYLDPEDGKYELAKILKLGDVLIEIRKFQTQIPASAMPAEDMTYTLWLHGLKPLTPEVLEKLSLEHKERELEAQK